MGRKKAEKKPAEKQAVAKKIAKKPVSGNKKKSNRSCQVVDSGKKCGKATAGGGDEDSPNKGNCSGHGGGPRCPALLADNTTVCGKPAVGGGDEDSPNKGNCSGHGGGARCPARNVHSPNTVCGRAVVRKSKGGSGKKCIWHGGGAAFRRGAQVLINALKSAAQTPVTTASAPVEAVVPVATAAPPTAVDFATVQTAGDPYWNSLLLSVVCGDGAAAPAATAATAAALQAAFDADNLRTHAAFAACIPSRVVSALVKTLGSDHLEFEFRTTCATSLFNILTLLSSDEEQPVPPAAKHAPTGDGSIATSPRAASPAPSCAASVVGEARLGAALLASLAAGQQHPQLAEASLQLAMRVLSQTDAGAAAVRAELSSANGAQLLAAHLRTHTALAAAVAANVATDGATLLKEPYWWGVLLEALVTSAAVDGACRDVRKFAMLAAGSLLRPATAAAAALESKPAVRTAVLDSISTLMQARGFSEPAEHAAAVAALDCMQHALAAGLAAGEEGKLNKPLTVVQALLANEAAEPSVRTAAKALLLTLNEISSG